jgi:DNA-binding CsgD family transcriptional regulator
VELLERGAELERIRALVRDTAAGRGRLLLIEGAAGIGKTALLEAACSLAGAAGLRVCRARGSELERELAYGVVRQLLERPLRSLRGDERGRLFDGVARVAEPVLWLAAVEGPAGAADGGAPVAGVGRATGTGWATGGQAMEVLHGLYWVCANLAEERPLLLAVDDAHWADEPSARFVEYLARRVHELPILLLLTRRTSEPAAATPRFLRLAMEPKAERLRPVALSEAAIAVLVRARWAAEADEAFCRACHKASGGNPFLARELLEAASAAGVEATERGAAGLEELTPAAVAISVELRLAALPADAVGLARAVAVLGGNAELRHAAGVAGLAADAAARAADSLAAAAILGRARPLDFIHPLVRAAVSARMPAAARSEAHARAARLLAADRAPSSLVGLHLQAAEPAGDPWTVELLRRAARDALAQGAPRAAVGYLSRALAEPPPAPARAAVLGELGNAELRVGEAAALDHLREALELVDDVGTRAWLARSLALALLWADQVDAAEEVLDPTLAAVAVADPELAVRLEAEVLSAARLSLSAGMWGAERVERWRGRLRGDGPGERLLLANLATQTSLGDFTAEQAAELAERAAMDGRLLEEQTADAMPFYQVVYVLTSADRLESAERLAAMASVEAQARRSLHGTLLAALFGSYPALRRGDVATAEARATTARELAEQLDAPRFLLPPCLASLVDVLIERDRLDQAERLLQEHGLAAGLPDTVPFRLLLFSRGNLRAAQGRWREAADDLIELGRRQESWRALNPHLAPHDAAAAIALAALGARDAAVAHARRALARARRWGTGSATGLALRSLALAGPDPARVERLGQAAAALTASPARLDEARVLVELGAALRRAGRRTDAATALRRALDLAGRAGGLAVAARARDELRGLGLRPRRAALEGIDSLTGSERRVAELAAAGSTNREIAQALFVTLRTVEVHLTHAYRKLGIRSRAELARALTRGTDRSVDER